LLASSLAVNAFRDAPPPCDAARPAHCPRCAHPSRPLGAGLGMHSHGVRARQQRGPPEPGAPPAVAVLSVRRYRCVHCGATCTVAPADVLPRKLFSGPAIAMALTLWALLATAAHAVGARVNPWTATSRTAREGWPSLPRWACDPTVFAWLRQHLDTPGRSRAQAAHLGQRLVGHAPPAARALPLEAQAFLGARVTRAP
jgi:hypothetical protein